MNAKIVNNFDMLVIIKKNYWVMLFKIGGILIYVIQAENIFRRFLKQIAVQKLFFIEGSI